MNTPDIKWIGCAPNNFREGRPAEIDISAVVIHIADGTRVGTDATFLNDELDAPRSAHYLVGCDGAVHQYVQESDTAFHCGVIVNPVWKGLKKSAAGGFLNPNSYTIGIEHEGRPEDDWTDPMYASTAAMLKAISSRYPALRTLTRDNVIMHREIRADKTCPGFKVDMDRLIRQASAPDQIDV